MEYSAASTGDLPKIARDILSKAGDFRLFAFYGNMGVGKTTLILQLIQILGVKEPGSSPTFSIVNEYRGGDNEPVYHFDFYRIESIDEVYDIGYEEYFFSDSWCFMEWPERIEELLPDETVKIFITEEENVRKIKVELPSCAQNV